MMVGAIFIFRYKKYNLNIFERMLKIMDTCRYKRGQIWMYSDNDLTSFKPGVQRSDRPILIFSNDRGNESCESIIALMITSNSTKGGYSVNVPFKNIHGETNVILCNQIQTVSKSDLRRYICTVSDSILSQVEKAHAIAVGTPATEIETKIDKIYTILEDLSVIKSNSLHNTSTDEAVIADVACELQKIYSKMAQYHDATVLDLKSTVSSLSDNNAKLRMGLISNSGAENSDPVELSKKKVAGSHISTTAPAKRSPSKRKPSGYWTAERIDEFVSDKQSMSLQDWMKKYDYTSEKSAMKAYYTYKGRRNGDNYGQ